MTEVVSPLARYIELRDAGDGEGALAAARAACAETPEAASAHYALGEILTRLGDHRGAGAAFADALRRAPGWADAWVNLGLSLYRQDKPWAAKGAMREALKAAPGHPAASANLGALMRVTGEAVAGETLLRETLEQTPEAIAARLNLVADLLQRDRTGEALAALEAAPEPPTELDALRHWHLSYALAFLRLGRAEAAAAAVANFEAVGPIPPAVAPMWRWRRVLLAQLKGDMPAARDEAGLMATAIEEMGPNATPEHRIIAHYDLGRFWSGLGEREAAFEQWNAGHRLLRQFQPFSRELFGAYVDANIAAYDRAPFRLENIAANRDPAPVFIVGMPRSGTSLCEQILSAHHAVYGAGERVALGRMAVELGAGDNAAAVRRVAALEPARLDEAAERYLADLHALAPDKARIVDKMPGNELYIGLIGRMLPGAKIIHCVRDPRDIGLSIWTFRFFGEHPYAHDLADLGWTIGVRARLIAHWRDVLPNPILTVALQDWVEDFDGTLARVLTHLDLPPDPNCARFFELDREVRTASFMQVRRPINAQGIGRWRPFEEQLQPLIRELEAAGMLEAREP